MTNDIVEKIKPSKAWLRIAGLCASMLVIITLVSLRNILPFSFPTLYAEDGKWLGQIMTNGFWDAAMHGRSDFPVLGLTSLLYTARLIVKVFYSNNLTYLPMAVAIVSTLFISLWAFFSFRLAPAYLSAMSKLALVASIIFMPVGGDGNEIFGRVLNLGFIFPVFQLILLIRLLESPSRILFRIFAAFFLLVAGLTFPVCMVFNLLALCIFVLRYYWEPSNSRQKSDLLLALLLLIVTVLSILPLGTSAFTSKGGANLPYNPAGLVDFALARSILYPFVHFVYNHLTDNIVLSLAIPLLMLLFVASLLVVIRKSPRRYVVLLTGGTWLSYFLATIILRSGFTTNFGTYTNTFPDRYFYGLNSIFLFFILYLAEATQFFKKNRLRNVLVPLAICFFLGLGVQDIFGRSDPQLTWGSMGTFQYTVCNLIINGKPIKFDTNAALLEIPIYPESSDFGWRFQAPRSEWEFLDSLNCEKILKDKRKQPF